MISSTTPHTEPASMPRAVDRSTFIDAMAHAVNGVSILATDGPGGRFGITVSSVASVSADPPLLLVCVNRRSPIHGAIHVNGTFTVNLLSASQRGLADTFAGRPASGAPYAFSSAVWSRGTTGSPGLSNAVSTFECELEQSHLAGTHTIFIGRVVAATDNGGRALLYADRAYGVPYRWR